jgi:hypothetical protein
VLGASFVMPRRAHAIVRRLALSLAILGTLLAAPATWGASGACSGPAHDPLLSAGRAAPATGTTATVFTFSVSYSDTKGCAPLWVRVTISGVGTFPMSGSGTSYDTGVTFTAQMRLPVGSHTYSFAASSGIGNGQKTVTLTSVTPGTISVTAPPPPPTPVPTPKPTAIPTPVPTSVPTPSASPSPSDSATGSPIASSGTGSSLGPSPSLAGGIAPSGEPSPEPGSFNKPEEMGSFAMILGGWAAATLGGVALFLYLAPRRRPPGQAAFADGQARPGPREGQFPGAQPGASLRPDPVPADEANIPRWLRPSVQAARHEQRGSRPGRRVDRP